MWIGGNVTVLSGVTIGNNVVIGVGAVMVVHGEKAHSRYFGETAFKKLKGANKELVIVPGAVHCDLYDGGGKDAIPFDKIEEFYRKNLK